MFRLLQDRYSTDFEYTRNDVVCMNSTLFHFGVEYEIKVLINLLLAENNLTWLKHQHILKDHLE